uniref:Prominin-1-like isoform X1 n=1 Tax=Diabrotica virgifera virgifera TaxID=50390 RepID=A0A6P7FWT0_DIAVI
MAADMSVFDNLKAQLPDYDNYTHTNQYTAASITFSPGGMKGLYDMTRSFVDSLLPANFLSEDLFSWDDDNNPSLNTSYADLAMQYAGLIAFFGFILLLLVLIPVCGLIFACCRCCGLCGAKARVSEKKQDLCLKIILGILLVICCAVLLFGIASAFATTHRMKTGVNQLRENGRKVYNDSVGYIEDVKDHVHFLLEADYDKFSGTFKQTLKDSTQDILNNLPLWNDVTIITTISTFADKLTYLKTDLDNLQRKTDQLKTTGSSLTSEMADIQKGLKDTLEKCGPSCADAEKMVNDLKIIDVKDIPAIPDIFNGVIIGDIQKAATSANDLVQKVPDTINSQIQTVTAQVDTEIDKAGATIKDNTKTMDDLVDKVKEHMKSVYSSFGDRNDYLEKYYPYFYYVGIVVSCVLLLILVFLFFGLVFGLFGNRPDKYKSYCCSKGTGSVFLMTAVALIFIITVIICIMTLVMSVGGIAADRIICYPLRNPDKSSIITVIDKYIDKHIKDDNEFSFNITTILDKCYNNKSIYEVLDLKTKSQFDIDKTIGQFNITQNIDDMVDKVGDAIDKINFNFLEADTEEKLNELTNIDVKDLLAVFEKMQDILKNNIVDVDLKELVDTLNNIAANLNNVDQELAANLTNQIKDLEDFNTNKLKPFIEDINIILAMEDNLQKDLKMGSQNFPEAIQEFIGQIETAQNKFTNDTKATIDIFEEGARTFGKLIENLINGYTGRISSEVQNELGKCTPLNVAIHGGLTAFCDKIALPWNGFWTSLFVCLVTFVPILILSIWLASIYKSYKDDGQHLIREPQHRGKKNKKDNFNDYYNMPPRNHENPLGKSHNDDNHNYYNSSAPNDNRNSRYYDMAPKFNKQHEASTRF